MEQASTIITTTITTTTITTVSQYIPLDHKDILE